MKLLFVAYGGGHMRLLHHIIQKVINETDFEVRVLALTTGYLDVKEYYSEEILKRPINYKDLFNKDLERIQFYGNELLKENHNPASGLEEEDSIFYLGMSFNDLALENGEEGAWNLYNEKKRHAFLPKRSMKKIIEHESPDVIITTTSPKCELASLFASKELKIPSIQIIDLFGDNYPIPFADDIIVLNEDVKQKLDSRVGDNSRVHAFGQPVFDYTVSKVEEVDKDVVRERLGISKEKPVLLFSPSRYLIYSNDRSILKELDHHIVNEPVFKIFNELRKKYDFNVIVRPHPNDRADKFLMYVEENNFIDLYKNEDLSLYESISVSDFVVAYNSTILIESALCGKIAFPHNYDQKEAYHWPELMRSPFVYSSNFKNLKNNLDNVLGKSIKSSIERPNLSSFYNKGAVDKVINLIKQK
jgi:hypothetical protein